MGINKAVHGGQRFYPCEIALRLELLEWLLGWRGCIKNRSIKTNKRVDSARVKNARKMTWRNSEGTLYDN